MNPYIHRCDKYNFIEESGLREKEMELCMPTHRFRKTAKMFFHQSTHHPLESSDRLQNFHPDNNWFCSSMCEDVFIGLQKLSGKPFPVDETNLS